MCWDFLDGCLRICSENSEIQNGGFNRVEQKYEKLVNDLEIQYVVIFWIADYEFSIKIVKFKMADQKYKKLIDECKNGYVEVFLVRWLRIWSQNSKIQNEGSKMADEKSKKIYVKVLRVVGYESEVKIPKFKMADHKNRTNYSSSLKMCMCVWSFFGLLVTNLKSKCQNSKCQAQTIIPKIYRVCQRA